jgi:hypothetical protein
MAKVKFCNGKQNCCFIKAYKKNGDYMIKIKKLDDDVDACNGKTRVNQSSRIARHYLSQLDPITDVVISIY